MSRVDWTDLARDMLADIWVQATPAEQDVIEKAVLTLERDLARGPLDVGESRGGELRVETRPPLTVWFRVPREGLEVRVFRVLRPTRRGGFAQRIGVRPKNKDLRRELGSRIRTYVENRHSLGKARRG